MKSGPPHNWALRLRRFVARRGTPESCDLCVASIAASHPHLLDRDSRQLLCVCEQCAQASGGGERFVLVWPRTEMLRDSALSDSDWEALQIPIGMAFLFQSASAAHPLAVYPSPAGATQSELSLDAWTDLVAANPVLSQLKPDVEALLVNRVNGAREYYCVSIDRCYQLVGLVRQYWRGFSGGSEAWNAIAQFFEQLREPSQQPTGDHGLA